MAISDRLNKLTTDITSAYTSIENKGGTIPANKNTNNLSTAIDSIEVIEQATAEGESLSLTNTKAMPYSDYVVKGKSEQDGEPSPSNPSEIHSVADDVNLFDKEKASINSGAIKTVLDTGVRITLSSSGTYKSCGIEIGGTELLGKTITLYSKITPSSNNKGAVFIYYGNSSNMAVLNAYANITSTGSLTKTLVSEFPTNCDRVYALFYGNRDGTGNNDDYVDYTNVKLCIGDIATPYSPYNKGTVTIKQRGKNLWNDNDMLLGYWAYADGTYIRTNTWICTPKIACKGNVDYTFQFANNSRWYGFVWYDENNNFISTTNQQNNLQTGFRSFTAKSPSNAGYLVINIAGYPGTNDTIRTDDLINFQLEESSTATTYEPYQANDYTFQTEPLRSLPNGVKDTIEAEQHRKIGKQTGTLTETTTITLSDAKTNGAYMCNIKPSGTLTGKTIELEAGDYEIIYELAEEIIEPLTQNQATTMLDIIKTGSYEGTTNIYTDEDVKPTIKADYYKKK